jgi:hypothetical protein
LVLSCTEIPMEDAHCYALSNSRSIINFL